MYDAENISGAGPQRDSKPEFVSTLRHTIGHEAKDAPRGQHKRQCAKDHHQYPYDFERRYRVGYFSLECTEVVQGQFRIDPAHRGAHAADNLHRVVGRAYHKIRSPRRRLLKW